MNNSKLSISYSIIIILTIWICILSAYPFTFSQFLPIPSVPVVACLSLFIVSVCLFILNKLKSLPKLFNQVVILQIFGWCLLFLVHRDGTYITRIAFICLAYTMLLLLHNSYRGINGFAKAYDKIMTIMGILGCLTFFLVLVFNISPIFSYINDDGRPGWCYGLTCTNAILGNVIRYSGFFDEPGAMAFWGMYAIILNEIFFKNKFIEKILPIVLAFTFSLAFYIQYAVFFLLFKIKTFGQILLMLLAVLIIGTCIKLTENSEYAIIYEMTLERLEYDEQAGTFKGNNRADLSVNAKRIFLSSPIIGKGPQIMTKVEGMGDNPYENLATDGILGTLVMYLPLLFILLMYNKKNIRYGVIVLMLGYLQRPFHTNLIHIFMLYLFTVLTIMTYTHSTYGKLYKNISNNSYV